MSPSRAGALAAAVLALVAGAVVVGITAFDGGDGSGSGQRALPGVPPLRDPDQLAPDQPSGDRESGEDRQPGTAGEPPLRIGARSGGPSAGGTPAPGPATQLPLAGLLPVGGVPSPGLPIDVPLPPVPVPAPLNPPGVAQTITVAVEDVAGNPALDALVVYVNGEPRERFVYPDADIAGLVAQINSSSTLISATLVLDGVPLAHSAPAPVASGGLDLPAAGGLPVSPLHIDAAVGAVTSAVATAAASLSVEADTSGARTAADGDQPAPEPGEGTSDPPADSAPPAPAPTDPAAAQDADSAPVSVEGQEQPDPVAAAPSTGTIPAAGEPTQDAAPADATPTPAASVTATTPTPPATPAAAPATPEG